jgi:hypothetical protein
MMGEWNNNNYFLREITMILTLYSSYCTRVCVCACMFMFMMMCLFLFLIFSWLVTVEVDGFSMMRLPSFLNYTPPKYINFQTGNSACWIWFSERQVVQFKSSSGRTNGRSTEPWSVCVLYSVDLSALPIYSTGRQPGCSAGPLRKSESRYYNV